MTPDKTVVDYFYKHVVPILFTFKKGSEYQNVIVTTFVLSISNQWLLITAGHCIAEIEKLKKDTEYIFIQCKLIDCLGLDAVNKNPIPFVYESSSPSILSDSYSFDYGVIRLSHYYKELLIRNNVEALDEEAWKKQPAEVDFYIMLGIPAELVTTKEKNISITPAMFKVNKLRDKPDGFSDSSVPLFYGHIELLNQIESIQGMSGGPILAFHKNKKGEVRYWLTAIQSRWLPESHYVAACPTNLLTNFLDSLIL